MLHCGEVCKVAPVLFGSKGSISAVCYAHSDMCELVHHCCNLAVWLFAKTRNAIEYVAMFLADRLSGRIEPTTFLFGEGILYIRLYRQSNLDRMHYSWIIKTFSSVQLTTVHANLIEQTTSSIELVVLKRRIIAVIRKDSRCLLLHRLEQHRRICLSNETYRTLAQPADPCGNHFGDMIWKIPNPTLIPVPFPFR